MPTISTPLLRGFETWRWYRHFFRDPLSCLAEVHRQFGPISVFENPTPGRRHGQRYVLAVGAAFNKQVLGKPDDFRPSGQVLKGPRGSALQRIRNNILKMHGDEHRAHRRLMQPPFAKSAVATSVAMMAPLVDEIIDRWKFGAALDIFEEMRSLSNWVSANVLFGNADFSASFEIANMIDRLLVLDAATRRFGNFERDLPGTPYRRELRHAETLEKTMRRLIAHKRRAKSMGDDVLSMLIRVVDAGGSGMSDDDLIAHSVVLYGAGFETTTCVLAWTLFLLAQHPKCAARLQDEVSRELGGWPPDSRKLDSLPYLDSVIRESMRLLPPVPVTFRRVAARRELGGVQLEPGDKVVLSHFLTQRDPAVFPKPSHFDPTRWFGERPDPYQYLPFGAGPRLCLGAVFAMTELKLVIARVIEKYRLSVVPGAEIDAVVHLVLKPKGGLPMLVHRQDRKFSRSPIRGNILRQIDFEHSETESSVAGNGALADADSPA